MERIVLAYSGDLDTSVAIPWLAGTAGAEIVTVTMDLGQGKELEAVRDRALAAGAVRAHVLDVRDEFARDYVLPALKAGAGLTGPALGRPLLARKLVEIAAIEQAGAIAHGSTGRGPDERRLDLQARLDVTLRALNPAIALLAPAREWRLTGPEKIEYAKARGIPVPATGHPYTIDATLWERSIDRGVLEDAWTEPPEEIYTLTKPAEECPSQAAHVEMMFERGVPTAINGVVMPLVELIASLGTIAGAHGVGRGLSPRGIYEAPAAVVLQAAHRELQRMVSTREAARFLRLVSLQYADIAHNGQWFTPLREALDACVDKVQARVTGVVRLSLFKGHCRVAGRKSPFALHDGAPATYGAGDASDRPAEGGFGSIPGLPAEPAARKV
jgi:argininosuccinate synthase